MERCFVPSEYAETQGVSSVIGEIVEKLIQPHYCRVMGGCQPWDPSGSGNGTDFFDTYRGPHRCKDLAEYLGHHNPWLDEQEISRKCLAKKNETNRFAVPDIIRHTPAGKGEFYEVKPNSAAGRAAGRDKVLWFERVIAEHGLPYEAGVEYSVNKKILLFDGTWHGIPMKLRLHWWLENDGLLLYEFCAEIGRETVSETLVKLIIAALLAALLLAAPELSPVLILADATSPLQNPMGPPDGIPAIPDLRGFAYTYLLTTARASRRGTTPHPLFLAVVIGTDPPEEWAAPDPRPWHWNEATMAEIGDIAPTGRFEPRGSAIRALELDQLLADQAALTPEAREITGSLVGVDITDEEGDGGPLTLHQLAIDQLSAYLKAFADEAVYYLLENPGHW